jgi:hypothetical protein
MEERDHNIAAIRMRLIERGIISNDEQISRQPRETPSGLTRNAGPEKRGTTVDSAPKMLDEPNDAIGIWNRFAWAAGVLIAIGLLWFSLKKWK